MTCRNPYCHRAGECVAVSGGMPRTVRLTDKGRAAIGVPVLVPVPLLNVPMRDDERDRR